jgi:hypothetical protein
MEAGRAEEAQVSLKMTTISDFEKLFNGLKTDYGN